MGINYADSDGIAGTLNSCAFHSSGGHGWVQH